MPLTRSDAVEAATWGTKVFFRVLTLHPVQIIFASSVSDTDFYSSSQNPLILRLNTVAGAMPTIDQASLGFNALVLDNPFCTHGELMGIVGQHYVKQGLLMFHRVLLSLEVPGNPVQLLKGPPPLSTCLCVCVRACARVRACACACV